MCLNSSNDCRELASSHWRNEKDCDWSRLEFWCENGGKHHSKEMCPVLHQSLKQQNHINSDVSAETFRAKECT